MKQSWLKCFTLIVLLVLFCGCPVQQTTCIKIYDNNTITELGDCDNSSMKIVFFNIEKNSLPDPMGEMQLQYLYVDHDSVESLMGHFSERETLEIEAFNRIKSEGAVNRVSLIRILNRSGAHQEIVPLLFFPSEDQKTLYMKNPFNDENINITKVDFVKFRGTHLIPVPPL